MRMVNKNASINKHAGAIFICHLMASNNRPMAGGCAGIEKWNRHLMMMLKNDAVGYDAEMVG